LTCPNVVVVHDLVEEWATFVDRGVEVPEPDGEGEKMDAAVAANILYVSYLFPSFFSLICPAPFIDQGSPLSIESLWQETLMRLAWDGGGGGLTWRDVLVPKRYCFIPIFSDSR
jgi:hypothetical protein